MRQSPQARFAFLVKPSKTEAREIGTDPLESKPEVKAQAIEEDDSNNKKGGWGGNFPKNHFCFYVPLKKTFLKIPFGHRFMERCKCNRFKLVEYKFNVGESKIPELTAWWYDREGKLERITGTQKPNNDSVDLK